MNYISMSLENLSKKGELRDLGKLMAEPNEYIVRDWINKNTKLHVVKRDEVDVDSNASGYDLITTDMKLRIQVKLRAKALHLEQTRRKSKKNTNNSSTGHVKYAVGEADVYMFSRPDLTDYVNVDKWEYIAIPESALLDPKNPGYLVPRITSKLWKPYVGKAKEILQTAYDMKK